MHEDLKSMLFDIHRIMSDHLKTSNEDFSIDSALIIDMVEGKDYYVVPSWSKKKIAAATAIVAVVAMLMLMLAL